MGVPYGRREARQAREGLFQVVNPRALETVLISSFDSRTSWSGRRTPNSSAARIPGR